jgi:hypothetical protein
MTVHIDIERMTQGSLRSTGAATPSFIDAQRPHGGRNFVLALAIGLVMWAGIIAAAPSMLHFVMALIHPV